MKKFIVIALSLGGYGKKVFDSGDIITQNDVAASVESLLEQKFIKEYTETDEEKAKAEAERIAKEKEESDLLAQLQAEEDAKKAADEAEKKASEEASKKADADKKNEEKAKADGAKGDKK